MAQKKKAPEGFITLHINQALLNHLTDEECGKLYRALFAYSEHGTIANFKGNSLLELAFEVIAEQIDWERDG